MPMVPTRILAIGADSKATHLHRYSRTRSMWCTGLVLRRCGVRNWDHVTPARHGFFLAFGVGPHSAPAV